MARTRDAGVDPQHIVDPTDPALSDEELDETVPGGAYIVNDVPMDCDGNVLEAPPDPPIGDPMESGISPEIKAERLRERQKWEQDKLKWEINKEKRDKFEKDKKDREKERDKERAKAEQLPAEPGLARPK